MELYVVIYTEVTLTWKCEWLIPIEWDDYIEMIYDIMNNNEMDLIIPIVGIHNILYSS